MAEQTPFLGISVLMHRAAPAFCPLCRTHCPVRWHPDPCDCCPLQCSPAPLLRWTAWDPYQEHHACSQTSLCHGDLLHNYIMQGERMNCEDKTKALFLKKWHWILKKVWIWGKFTVSETKIFLITFIYFYSVTIVCIFSPSLHPTPASPTFLPHLYPPPWFCPCVLYSSSNRPLSPLSPPRSPVAIVTMFLNSMSLVIFCLLFSFVDYVPVKGDLSAHQQMSGSKNYGTFTQWNSTQQRERRSLYPLQ